MLLHAQKRWLKAVTTALWPYTICMANDVHLNTPSLTSNRSPPKMFASSPVASQALPLLWLSSLCPELKAAVREPNCEVDQSFQGWTLPWAVANPCKAGRSRPESYDRYGLPTVRPGLGQSLLDHTRWLWGRSPRTNLDGSDRFWRKARQRRHLLRRHHDPLQGKKSPTGRLQNRLRRNHLQQFKTTTNTYRRTYCRTKRRTMNRPPKGQKQLRHAA